MTFKNTNNQALLKKRLEQLRAIAGVSRDIVSELDMDKLFDRVVTLLHERFGYQFVHIFIVRPSRQVIEFKAGFGRYLPAFKKGLLFDLNAKKGIIPWVARSGKSALINNVYEDSHFEPLNLPGIEIKSELTVPLNFGDEVLGVFDVESEELNAFSADDQWLLETLAANIAIAIRNATLYRSERWRAQAADSLREIAGVVRAKETLDNTLKAILNELATILPVSFATIWLKLDSPTKNSDHYQESDHYFDENLDRNYYYQFKIGYNTDLIPLTQSISHPWFDKIVSSKSSLVRQIEDPPSPLAEILAPDHSALGAVLAMDENILGVLILVQEEPNRFGIEACRLAEIFASQAAIVIRNTDLYHSVREQAWISTALLQVAEATRSLQTLNDVLVTVTQIVPIVSSVEACAIWLRTPEFETYFFATAYGFSQKERACLQTTPLFKTNLLTAQLAILKRPITVLPTDAPNQLPSPLVPFFADKITLFLPLLNQGELNGIMMMVLIPGQVLSDNHLQMLNGIAHQAASAIQTAQLIEAQQTEAYISTALLQVAQTVASTSGLYEVLEAIVRITPMLTGATHCLILLHDAQESCTLAAAYGISTRNLPIKIPITNSVALQTAIQNGHPYSLTHLSELPSELQTMFTISEFDGLILPLSVQGNSVGALVVIDNQPYSIQPSKRFDMLTGIAYQIALAVDNARLHAEQLRQEQLNRDLALGHKIQASFMPQELPNLSNWELASFWQAANQVGGDFFDVISITDNELLFIIADVADKGLAAALFMARTTSFVRATALELNQPSEILNRVNQLLIPDAHQGMFVTVFCATLNLETGELHYASAGHNPPILVKNTMTLHPLKADGIVLGILEEATFEQKTIHLDAGDGILFYTDGVTEAFNHQDEEFGEQRLQNTLKKHWHLSASELVETIHQTVFAFAHPRPQSDDFTMLFLRKNKKG